MTNRLLHKTLNTKQVKKKKKDYNDNEEDS